MQLLNHELSWFHWLFGISYVGFDELLFNPIGCMYNFCLGTEGVKNGSVGDSDIVSGLYLIFAVTELMVVEMVNFKQQQV